VLRPADKAWLALAAGVLAYDTLARPGEMLSDASRRYATARPVLARVVIAYTAGHLAHVIPERVDLFTLTAKALGR
jgi:hypothetical protein